MDIWEQFKKYASAEVEAARSLPPACYSSPDFYAAERERIFRSDWVFVCNSAVLAKPGDRFAVNIAGEPVVVVRGNDEKLRALSNSCSHRGTPICDLGFSQGPNMVCPYHSWNFTLDGELKGAPYTGCVEIDKEAHALPEYQLEVWCGLVFVNIDGNAKQLEERYAPIVPYLESYGCAEPAYGAEQEAETWASNWKLVIENAMESYHLFKVHKPTLETVTPTKGAFYVEGCADWALTAGEYTGYMDGVRNLVGASKKGPNHHYLLVCLPPSFVGIASAEGYLGYLAMLPDGPGQTYTRAGVVSANSIQRSSREEDFTAAFFAEDKWICERAFTGMESARAGGGQLVELERIVHAFHRYLGSRLCDLPAGGVYKDPLAEEKGLTS